MEMLWSPKQRESPEMDFRVRQYFKNLKLKKLSLF